MLGNVLYLRSVSPLAEQERRQLGDRRHGCFVTKLWRRWALKLTGPEGVKALLETEFLGHSRTASVEEQYHAGRRPAMVVFAGLHRNIRSLSCPKSAVVASASNGLVRSFPIDPVRRANRTLPTGNLRIADQPPRIRAHFGSETLRARRKIVQPHACSAQQAPLSARNHNVPMYESRGWISILRRGQQLCDEPIAIAERRLEHYIWVTRRSFSLSLRNAGGGYESEFCQTGKAPALW